MWIVRVHDAHTPFEQERRESKRQSGIEPAALGDGLGLGARRPEAFGVCPFRPWRERDRKHAVPGLALLYHQVERDAFLPSGVEGREHVSNRKRAHRPKPRSMTQGVRIITESSVRVNVLNRSSPATYARSSKSFVRMSSASEPCASSKPKGFVKE